MMCPYWLVDCATLKWRRGVVGRKCVGTQSVGEKNAMGRKKKTLFYNGN